MFARGPAHRPHLLASGGKNTPRAHNLLRPGKRGRGARLTLTVNLGGVGADPQKEGEEWLNQRSHHDTGHPALLRTFAHELQIQAERLGYGVIPQGDRKRNQSAFRVQKQAQRLTVGSAENQEVVIDETRKSPSSPQSPGSRVGSRYTRTTREGGLRPRRADCLGRGVYQQIEHLGIEAVDPPGISPGKDLKETANLNVVMREIGNGRILDETDRGHGSPCQHGDETPVGSLKILILKAVFPASAISEIQGIGIVLKHLAIKAPWSG